MSSCADDCLAVPVDLFFIQLFFTETFGWVIACLVVSVNLLFLQLLITIETLGLMMACLVVQMTVQHYL